MYANEFKTRGKEKTKTYWNEKLTATHTYPPTLPFNVGLTGLLGPHYLVNINIEEEDSQQSLGKQFSNYYYDQGGRLLLSDIFF